MEHKFKYREKVKVVDSFFEEENRTGMVIDYHISGGVLQKAVPVYHVIMSASGTTKSYREDELVKIQ